MSQDKLTIYILEKKFYGSLDPKYRSHNKMHSELVKETSTTAIIDDLYGAIYLHRIDESSTLYIPIYPEWVKLSRGRIKRSKRGSRKKK